MADATKDRQNTGDVHTRGSAGLEPLEPAFSDSEGELARLSNRVMEAATSSRVETPIRESGRETVLPGPEHAEGSAHTTSRPVAPSRRNRVVPRRAIKITFSAALLAAGIYSIAAQQWNVTSDNAIVSAYVTAVRVPINGTLSGLTVTPGSRVEKGTVIGHVENSRAYDSRLFDLSAEQQQSTEASRAMAAEISQLLAQKRILEARAEAQRQIVSARLHLQIDEAARKLEAKRAAVREASLELNRDRTLQAAGVVTQADLDNRQYQSDVATQEEAEAKAALGALQLEADGASRGLLSEPGGTADVTYSEQRIDEITMRLAELRPNEATLAGRAHQAIPYLAQEMSHEHLMRECDLVAPVSGTVRTVLASNGERLSTGDTVVELVDPGQAFLLAVVPQDRVPEIQLRNRAMFKLSGESKERTGTVLSIGGDIVNNENRSLAAVPLKNPAKQTAIVRIGFHATDPGDRLIARTARVVIVASGRNPLSRWLCELM